MRSLMKDFKEFLVTGDLISLAVAFIMATALAAVLKALITDLITPLIGMIVGSDLSSNTFKVNGSVFSYGDFISAILTFVTIAAVVFFLIVRPYDAFKARKAAEAPTTKECPECLSEIPLGATRCPHCTAQLAAA